MQSAFGEQMDSLADIWVSFGAAPALIILWALTSLGRWGWIGALFIAPVPRSA
jgi:CDP-diacylglycerol--serine O-phosphatidyltransferase